MSLPSRFIAIDEEGYALSGETRWTDPAVGRELLENLRFAENGALLSESGGNEVIVEAFDEPLVAVRIEKNDSQWSLLFPYEHEEDFDPHTLRLDEWDRFHGKTKRGIPFVLSRPVQADFFDLLDGFDDESVTIDGERIELPGLFDRDGKIRGSGDWNQIYHDEQRPGWDLGEPAPALKDMYPRLRLPKCRILVPGCGEGHDAAYLAHEGHFVTGVDFSPEAIERARGRYGHLPNLKFIVADLFQLGPEHDAAYDVIFEQTCYCAIDPGRRPELVKRWQRWLAPNGHLMGVFFAMHKPSGPPYGGSEWELRERLRKGFRFLFWGRWQKSVPSRQGKELFVYASKL
ncbi:MAG: methyltransferase domain-containing protein [Bdellovibrionaceae bacterium]|nr:methyltransferase domain-containing protein [Pseudobdellovibrionaceae bacterium]MBX3032618.1 methyltransferase domain-containing protein [Pseudobdellovibrionaceae bacterium]